MTFLGLLTKALLFFGGVLCFWLVDREARPKASQPRPKADEEESADDASAEDRSQAVASGPFAQPLGGQMPYAAGPA
jgi:hypothetical protein